MLHCKFSGGYNSKRIFIIGQYLTKLCVEHLGFTFLAHHVGRNPQGWYQCEPFYMYNPIAYTVSQKKTRDYNFTAQKRGLSSQLSAGYCHFGWLSGCPSVRAIIYKQISTLSANGQWNSAACWLTSGFPNTDVIAFTSVIQRRFAIRVDSVPSRKLGPARTRPRVIVILSVRWTVSTQFNLRSWFLHHMVAPSL